MYKRLIIITFIAFLFTQNSFANQKKIIIEGNNRVSDETIKIYGEIDLGKEITDAKINSILKNLYETNFFEDVKISKEGNVLKINVKEYKLINQLLIVGEQSSKFKEEIKKNLNLKEKSSFIKSYLIEDTNQIKNFYSTLGFNFATVEAKFNEIDENNIDLIFEVNKGLETRISSITFIGNKKIKSKRLLDVIASEKHQFWKFISRNTKFSKNLVNLDIRLLKNYYQSLGYYNVSITSNSAELNESGNIDLIYSIEAGERFTINKISTNVDPVFDKKLFFSLENNYSKLIGDYYSPFKIKKLIDILDNLIEKKDLQFVEYNIEEELSKDNISIKINIFEGEKVLVEQINIIGNNITNENVIRGELVIDEGDPYSKVSLDKSVANLKSRRIFRSVTSSVKDGSADNLKIIDINVKEMPTGELSAGAGVGTNGGTVAFKISENNWLGEGKQINFSVETDEESIEGRLDYNDPNYNFLGNAIGYSIYSISNDKPNQGFENTLIGTSVGTKFEQYENIFAKLGLSASFDDLRTDSSASTALKKQSGEFTEIAANYGFDYDTRDRSFMPTSGSIIGFSQVLPVYADKNFIDNTFTMSKYISFTESVVIANKYYLSGIEGLNDEDVRLNKRKGLSTRRMRGFKKGKIGPKDGKDHIGGNYAAAINIEMNLPNLLPDSTNFDIGVFLDAGNVWGVDYDKTIDESNKLRSSSGIIANYSSPIGPMSFVFSQNISKASTDQTESFNFQLGTTF